MNARIKEIILNKGFTNVSLAEKMGISRQAVGQMLKAESLTTASLEKIATALDVEPWQLLAPPSVVEELKQARAQRSAGGGGGLVGVVRVGCEIYTADTVQQLRAIVENLEREEAKK